MEGSSEESQGFARSSGVSRVTITKVGLASLLSAATTYVVTLVGARALGTVEANTKLLTYLALLFACYGVLSGVATEMTRAVATATRQNRAHGPPVRGVAAILALACAAAVAVASPLSRHVLGVPPGDAMLLILPIGVAGFVVHSSLVGASSGRGDWSLCGITISTEAVSRLLFVLGAAIVGATADRLAIAATAAAWGWLFLMLSRRVRNTLTLRLDANATVAMKRIVASMLAQGASALLVVGFPVLLSLTTPDREYAGAAPFVLAITLTRAPLLIPLNAFQGVAISALVHAGPVSLSSRRLVSGAVVAGIVGVLLAGLVGPWLMTALYGEGYRVDGTTLSVLTLGALVLALLTLTGAACQALAEHRSFLAGWVTATASAFVVLLLPAPMEVRATAALIAGPLLGIVLHSIALRRRAEGRGVRSDR